MKIKFNHLNESFSVDQANQTSYLYFPLTNGYDLKSSITPNLNGDLKTDQNHFALVPVSQEDLQNSMYGRHFWLNIKDYGLYNVSGYSARQKYENKDYVLIEAGFLYHTIIRMNEEAGIETKATTFSPYGKDNIELTKITIKNISSKKMVFTPALAIPMFSRSADNLRDHRHVTALLNACKIVPNGIINRPTLSFDERGHVKNDVSYGVFINDEVEAYNPKLQEFIGEGGSLDWPKSLLSERIGNYQVGDTLDGYETIGAFQLKEKTLNQNESVSFIVAIAISSDETKLNLIKDQYLAKFDELLEDTKKAWEEKLSTFSIQTRDPDFDKWVKWVSLQPVLRRIFGCSFLPHHDYGRGGRGWRDLWQDCLALLLTESKEVKPLLFNNFGGIRIDGSNATIIGDKPGEFIADRNQIVRVWMDHGVWPWNTVKLYLERSGDYSFLFEKQSYFKDANIYLGKAKDENWQEGMSKQMTKTNAVYYGTVLEHILLQNLVQFYHVGEHNHILLDGADWNDGLDMAKDKGESVTFTAFYAMNLNEISEFLKELKNKGIPTVDVFSEMALLIQDEVDYKNPVAKKELLQKYFNRVKHQITGEVISLPIDDVIKSLQKKADFIKGHIKENEWIEINEKEGFFNGYYDNRGSALEGIKDEQIRMTLTGQVFPIMSGVATKKEMEMILNAAKHYLYDEKVAGYRLNTNFHGLKLDMGRLFGFAYGHKENGAMFSHMAMMFASALYRQNFTEDAYLIMDKIYEHCMNFEVSKIYPGIPEYIDPDGRGMYHYLTGSASWYILNVVNEMFGIKGKSGNLWLDPKLMQKQFDENNQASIVTEFLNHRIKVTYVNQSKEANAHITNVFVNRKEIPFTKEKGNGVVIDRKYFEESSFSSVEVVLNS